MATQHGEAAQHGGGRHPYRALGISLVLSLASMYVLMYLMVDRLDHVEWNVATLWMALAMVAPMGLIMFATMPEMFPDRRRNIGLIVAFIAMFLGAFWLDRSQALVGDDQFLRGMIPHHSAAIFMCREADLVDREIIGLCDQITSSQEAEIRLMEDILEGR